MADVTPNYELEGLRVELNIGELELSLKRMAVRKAELADELRRIHLNENATVDAIAEQRQKLSRIPRIEKIESAEKSAG